MIQRLGQADQLGNPNELDPLGQSMLFGRADPTRSSTRLIQLGSSGQLGLGRRAHLGHIRVVGSVGQSSPSRLSGWSDTYVLLGSSGLSGWSVPYKLLGRSGPFGSLGQSGLYGSLGLPNTFGSLGRRHL